jgi:hypothetical protein
MEQRDALFAILQGVTLDSTGRDEVSWAFEKSKNFTKNPYTDSSLTGV